MAGDDQKTAVEKLENKGGFPLSHRGGDLYQSIDRNLLYLDLEPDVSLSTARRTVKLSAAPVDMTCIRDECKERPVEMACIRDLAQGVSSWGRRLSFANGGADDGKREGGGQIKSARCGRFYQENICFWLIGAGYMTSASFSSSSCMDSSEQPMDSMRDAAMRAASVETP